MLAYLIDLEGLISRGAAPESAKLLHLGVFTCVPPTAASVSTALA
jgi:hypothetical protein